ncbi:unnamed protein product [Cyprideis torosa]|uniref:Uncharacterized protein n=1 Tax=Cyprideis torosa TaxID=163714 RepID=A0A7R8WDK1_9CRUS|nr:unnamed protein product [Cyprideis torosa]CAG0891862.1 unnamed protein product [Cyprideis torosa]
MSFCRHRSRVYLDGEWKFLCTKCGRRAYRFRGGLNQHMKYECGRRAYIDGEWKFLCTKCHERAYRFRGGLNQHMKEDLLFMNGEWRFSCPNPGCGKTYRFKKGVMEHLRLDCGREPMFKCPSCPKKFHHNYEFKRHYLLHHGVLPPTRFELRLEGNGNTLVEGAARRTPGERAFFATNVTTGSRSPHAPKNRINTAERRAGPAGCTSDQAIQTVEKQCSGLQ